MYNWKKIKDNNLEKILTIANSFFPVDIFSKNETQAKTSKLSFYKNYQLVELANHNASPFFKNAFLIDINNNNKPFCLNGDAEKIYMANKIENLHLDKKNAVEYIKFFFDFAFPPQGKMYVIENIENIKKNIELNESQEKELSPVFAPIKFAKEENNCFFYNLNMVFEKFIYDVEIEVKKDGKIDISEEKLLEKKLPFVINVSLE